jgi:hypothetical protein
MIRLTIGLITPGSGTTWGSGNLNRRAAGTGELPAQPTSIGAVGQKVRGNGSGTRNATYVNGTLGASGTSTGGGIFTQGTGTFAAPQGMNLAVPAAATPRGLTLYAFNKDGTAEVRLTFASGGGTTTVPLTSAAAGVTDWYVITIQYQSDTPTTLNVALVQTAVNSGADITAQMGLQAMTLKTLTPVSVTPGVTAQNATVAVASVENFPASLAVTAQNAASAFALSNVATSPDNTTVTTAGPTITDSNLNQWSLTADGHVQLNGANTSTGSPRSDQPAALVGRAPVREELVGYVVQPADAAVGDHRWRPAREHLRAHGHGAECDGGPRSRRELPGQHRSRRAGRHGLARRDRELHELRERVRAGRHDEPRCRRELPDLDQGGRAGRCLHARRG